MLHLSQRIFFPTPCAPRLLQGDQGDPKSPGPASSDFLICLPGISWYALDRGNTNGLLRDSLGQEMI